MSYAWTDKPIDSISADASMDHWDTFNNFTASHAVELLGPGKSSYNLRLACEELFSNIVRHAGSLSGPSDVKITVDVFKNNLSQTEDTTHSDKSAAIMVQISDTGPFFDPHFQTPRTIENDLSVADRPIGGLGLFLVQQSVDRAEYAWVNDKNRYRLYINNPPLPKSAGNQATSS